MNPDQLPKQYNPLDVERKWYDFWLSRGHFHAEPDPSREPYCIVIPPPNVTGALHLGHALNNTIQDILVRWRRMQGWDTLWMPGTDHAGIATQAVVEKRLFESEGMTRHDIGREALVERIWKWKDEYENRILSQLRTIGSSCDWERTRFTLDETCARAVRHTFFRLFKKGLIYRGKRLVNWDTHLQTAVADDEIFYETVQGSLWNFKYPLADGSGFIPIATTRPETMLGDTAVAVHPDDSRYREFIGKSVKLPFVNREIPVIGDDILVDPSFGTGAVKVTPAHDPNDYETGLRHGLPMINILTQDGKINEQGGPFQGMDRYEAREKVVAGLQELDLLGEIEPYENQVGHSDRSKTPIEPYLSDQWFVAMTDLAEAAMQAVRDGRVKFHPERYAKSYLDWLGEKRDWCISRQLWWGHRIPIWHCKTCDELELKEFAVSKDLQYGKDVFWRQAEHGGWLICALDHIAEDALGPRHQVIQDSDVLDTWFSSALWPYSTLGWPEKTPELEHYYPTSVLVTSRDIISLWVARMVITGLENMGDVPFSDVYIHAKILDGEGRSMSKSLGNGVDPLDIVEKYGADALRFCMAWLCTENQDSRLPVKLEKLPDGREINTSERFEMGRNFANKLWNASRFALMNLESAADRASESISGQQLRFEDRWVLSRLNSTIQKVEASLESFAINRYVTELHSFVWKDFCDWYVEMVKERLGTESAPEVRLFAQRCLAFVLDQILKLLHPVLPFVTEEIWHHLNELLPLRGHPLQQQLPASECIMISSWPSPDSSAIDPGIENNMEQFQQIVRGIRNIRKKLGRPEREKLHALVKTANKAGADTMAAHLPLLQRLALVGEVQLGPDIEKPKASAAEVVGDIEVYVPLSGEDLAAERKRTEGKMVNLQKQINSSKQKLGNESFVNNAPANVVERERQRLQEFQEQYERLAEILADIE